MKNALQNILILAVMIFVYSPLRSYGQTECQKFEYAELSDMSKNDLLAEYCSYSLRSDHDFKAAKQFMELHEKAMSKGIFTKSGSDLATKWSKSGLVCGQEAKRILGVLKRKHKLSAAPTTSYCEKMIDDINKKLTTE